jgi:hypothetical protein
MSYSILYCFCTHNTKKDAYNSFRTHCLKKDADNSFRINCLKNDAFQHSFAPTV